MISMQALNRGNYQVTEEVLRNLSNLCVALLLLEEAYTEEGGEEFYVTSGLRSHEDQMRINPKNPHSAHTEGLAADLADADSKIWTFCISHLPAIIELELYLEDKKFTPKHLHLQMRPPKSGKRVFYP